MEISSFYTCVPKTMITWCTVPEIWSTTDKTFLSFWTIFDLLPPNNAENQSFEKMKKNPGDIYYYFTHVYHRCQSFDVWFLGHGAQWTEFLVILGNFLPFLPLTRKIKILKKWKKYQDISFYKSVPKIMIICYTVPEIQHVTDVISIFHFGLFFALLTTNDPKDPKNLNLKKVKKKPGDIIILHTCTKNYDHMMYGSWNMVRDRRTDR